MILEKRSIDMPISDPLIRENYWIGYKDQIIIKIFKAFIE